MYEFNLKICRYP